MVAQIRNPADFETVVALYFEQLGYQEPISLEIEDNIQFGVVR